jgi:hypothetical protein
VETDRDTKKQLKKWFNYVETTWISVGASTTEGFERTTTWRAGTLDSICNVDDDNMEKDYPCTW